MNLKRILCLVLVLSCGLFGASPLLAAKPDDFTTVQLDEIWKEIWKSAAPNNPEPKVEMLSEQLVMDRMTGKWTVLFGVMPDKLTLSISPNHLAEVVGQKDGKSWKKAGQWRVDSGKLVLFLETDRIPIFIFRAGPHDYILDPWAKSFMSELKREK
jgi:hypothetical protein